MHPIRLPTFTLFPNRIEKLIIRRLNIKQHLPISLVLVGGKTYLSTLVFGQLVCRSHLIECNQPLHNLWSPLKVSWHTRIQRSH
jgi:hypothetical protein